MRGGLALHTLLPMTHTHRAVHHPDIHTVEVDGAERIGLEQAGNAQYSQHTPTGEEVAKVVKST